MTLYNFTVKATDQANNQSSRAFAIDVNSGAVHRFMAVGPTGALASPDGQIFSRLAGLTYAGRAIVWADDRWIRLTTMNPLALHESNDGLTWTQIGNSNAIPGTTPLNSMPSINRCGATMSYNAGKLYITVFPQTAGAITSSTGCYMDVWISSNKGRNFTVRPCHNPSRISATNNFSSAKKIAFRGPTEWVVGLYHEGNGAPYGTLAGGLQFYYTNDDGATFQSFQINGIVTNAMITDLKCINGVFFALVSTNTASILFQSKSGTGWNRVTSTSIAANFTSLPNSNALISSAQPSTMVYANGSIIMSQPTAMLINNNGFDVLNGLSLTNASGEGNGPNNETAGINTGAYSNVIRVASGVLRNRIITVRPSSQTVNVTRFQDGDPAVPVTSWIQSESPALSGAAFGVTNLIPGDTLVSSLNLGDCAVRPF